MSPESLLDDTQAEKQEVKGYFETTGFERWNRIYSESDDVNKVQRNIRIGHQKTVDEVLSWIKQSGELSDVSFCDAGCGVGSLSLPLAEMGAGSIHASDISEAMAQEAQRRAEGKSLAHLRRLRLRLHAPHALHRTGPRLRVPAVQRAALAIRQVRRRDGQGYRREQGAPHHHGLHRHRARGHRILPHAASVRAHEAERICLPIGAATVTFQSSTDDANERRECNKTW